MCTFTLIRWPDEQPGFRFMFNRDEQRSRPAGEPPRREHFGERHAILPRDPVAGGTWAGVNDAGLAMALLNVYPVVAPGLTAPAKVPSRGKRRRSRGWIIRQLLAQSTSRAALRAGEELAVHAYPPFLLLAMDDRWLTRLRWDGESVETGIAPLTDAPFLYVSSGLGDSRVEPPRRQLFDEMLVDAAPEKRLAQQEAYHRHVWPDHPELSVCMSRSDALSKSLTTVEVMIDSVCMRYYPQPPDQPVEPMVITLPRCPVAGA